METKVHDFVFLFFGGQSNNLIAKAMRWIAYNVLPRDSWLSYHYWEGDIRAECCKDCSRFA